MDTATRPDNPTGDLFAALNQILDTDDVVGA